MTKEQAKDELVLAAKDYQKAKEIGVEVIEFLTGLELNRVSDEFIQAGGTLDELYEIVSEIVPDVEKGSAFEEEGE